MNVVRIVLDYKSIICIHSALMRAPSCCPFILPRNPLQSTMTILADFLVFLVVITRGKTCPARPFVTVFDLFLVSHCLCIHHYPCKPIYTFPLHTDPRQT